MFSQQVILLFLKFFGADGFLQRLFCAVRAQYAVYYRCVIEEAVDVSAEAVALSEYLLFGGADSLMYLISFAVLSFEREMHLLCGLLSSHSGLYVQQSKSWKCWNTALYTVGIEDCLSQHLIASTYTYYGFAILMGADYGLRHTVATQFVEVVKSGFSARKDDYVGVRNILYIRGIE